MLGKHYNCCCCCRCCSCSHLLAARSRSRLSLVARSASSITAAAGSALQDTNSGHEKILLPLSNSCEASGALQHNGSGLKPNVLDLIMRHVVPDDVSH
jgi:hypothetical protein